VPTRIAIHASTKPLRAGLLLRGWRPPYPRRAWGADITRVPEAEVIRVVNGCAASDFAILFAMETALEFVRAHDFPVLPSRRGAIFLARTIPHAERFVARHRSGESRLYRVRATGEIWYGSLTIRGRNYAVRRGHSRTWWPQYKRAARAYWRSLSRRPPPPGVWTEMLVYGQVQIIGEIGRLPH
jgi:hypothetical protein